MAIVGRRVAGWNIESQGGLELGPLEAKEGIEFVPLDVRGGIVGEGINFGVAFFWCVKGGRGVQIKGRGLYVGNFGKFILGAWCFNR